MKISLTLSLLLSMATLFQGCGGEEGSKPQTETNSQVKGNGETVSNTPVIEDSSSFFDGFTWSSLWDWWESDDAEAAAVISLNDELIALAESSTDRNDFSLKGLKITVEYVVNEYFSIASGFFLKKDWGENDDQYLYESLYDSSDTLRTYMDEFYNDTKINNAPAYFHAAALEDDRSLIQKIIDEIFNILSEFVSSFFSSSDDVAAIVPDANATVIDPNQNFSFHAEDIAGREYFVASEQYMKVTFDDDGLGGYGDIGYGVGASFKSYVENEKLVIDMEGMYELQMLYKDPGYCIATEMTNTTDGSTYPAYWFFNEDTYNKATNMTTAKSLCYVHSSEYTPTVIAKDGVLEAIEDERVGHNPVSGENTVDVVTQLVHGIDRTANITDAKYFARKMRHGVFSLYTTNGQTDTLQATETQKINRELIPLVASSALGMQELMSGAYDSSVAFQAEVNRDLNHSVSEVNNRFDALITATSQAMDRTTSSSNYHGISDVTSFGDVVAFNTDIKQLSLFKNEATADVTITIKNTLSNGVDADVTFITEVKTAVIGDSEVKFSDIDATSASSYLSGSDYRLNIHSFNYHRSTGVMSVSGDGYLGDASRLRFDTYNVIANFSEDPTIKLLELKVTADGIITTTAGRSFDGILVFDGYDTANSYMDGSLVGINNEPKIDGVIKTSLSSQDITSWVSSHDDVSLHDAGDLENIGNQSYSMDVTIMNPGKSISADMLVKCDETADTWTYMVKDLNATDTNGNLSIKSVSFLQNGLNTIVNTLEKVAINGVGSDSDLNTMINFGWDIASDFDNIDIEGLSMVMKPASGDVNVKSTVHVTNNNATMHADMNTTYDYATTHVSIAGNYATTVDSSSGKNVYSNNFTTQGYIKVDNRFNYLYELAYTDEAQYILFTRDDIRYQMGFILRDSEIQGGDSYGVVANFIMNDSYDVLESMQLRNNDGNPLGIYNHLENTLQVKFADNVSEYMYLY